jgi:hypothetical protein
MNAPSLLCKKGLVTSLITTQLMNGFVSSIRRIQTYAWVVPQA